MLLKVHVHCCVSPLFIHYVYEPFYTIGSDFGFFSTRYVVQAGAPLPPQMVQIFTFEDTLPENTEGFIAFLELQESELDARDIGQVELVRSAYLVRINEPRKHMYTHCSLCNTFYMYGKY